MNARDLQNFRLLITGFGPFLQHRRNPSWDVARACASQLQGEYALDCEQVAVTYAAAERYAARAPWARESLVVLHFGLSAGGDAARVERYAHNCRGVTPDETGRSDWPDCLIDGGPTALETRFDTRALAAELDEALEVPVRPSRDVGEYVCNAIYYHSLLRARAARRQGRLARALFVHIPPLDEAAAADFGRRFAPYFRAHLECSLTEG